MMTDLLIKGGRIYDPGQKMDFIGDIRIFRGKIAAMGTELGDEAERTVDARGFYVLPGLIDVHTHINWCGNYIGMPADLACIPSGVTATIDAGSTGVSNYRALLRYIETCEVKAKIMLHASASGQIMSKQFSENIDPGVWNCDLFERAFEQYGDRIAGIKLRVSKDVVNDLGLRPLEAAIRLAERLNTRVCIHPTDPPVSMGALASCLREGDVMCHMYHGEGHTIWEDGAVVPEVQAAQRRGVIFDVSQGQGNFSLQVAADAIRCGFLPDTISTDLNIENWNHPLDFSLLMTMSKLMALGMKFADVVTRVTAAAAELYGMPGEMGILKVGTGADLTIVSLEKQQTEFTDKYQNKVRGEQILKPMATIIDGKLLYCSTDTLALR